MTIRKLWLIVLVIVSVVSIGINAFILTRLTNKNFNNYLKENYDEHVEQIIEYTKAALVVDKLSYNQMAIELETHLDDPIIKIKLYSPEGILLFEVDTDTYMNDSMMGNMMNGGMMEDLMKNGQDEVTQYTIEENGKTIGILNITRHSQMGNTIVARRFQASLLKNSIYSILISIGVSILIGIFISRKMSHTLMETAELATDIQFGTMKQPNKTSIKEVNTIIESLENLNTRLKLRQKSRKTLIDQLVHQTRTPLTILKSHLEAIEDGVIEMTDDEIKICQNQIENITAIISNMSGMIDANKDIDELTINSFEFNQLVNQIVAGLKAQFNKKDIQLTINSDDKITLTTDQYKLSQTIYNILTNAYKYTREKGQVDIEYKINNGHLIIRIQDTGMGIPNAEIEMIFRAYYRSNHGMKTDGEGIGLYIVRENLKRIKGNISVESEINVGSTFIIEIPIDINA